MSTTRSYFFLISILSFATFGEKGQGIVEESALYVLSSFKNFETSSNMYDIIEDIHINLERVVHYR